MTSPPADLPRDPPAHPRAGLMFLLELLLQADRGRYPQSFSTEVTSRSIFFTNPTGAGGDLPRFQRIMIMFRMMGGDIGSILLGMGYGVLGGGNIMGMSPSGTFALLSGHGFAHPAVPRLDPGRSARGHLRRRSDVRATCAQRWRSIFTVRQFSVLRVVQPHHHLGVRRGHL